MAAVPEHERLPVSEAKAGNAEAWATLFQRYRLPLFVYIMQMVREEQASFDIVQETMISAIKYIGSLHNDDKFGGWLFGIAHQKCIQHWRKQNREEAALSEIIKAPADPTEDAAEIVIREEQQAEFFTVLEKLPTAQRSVLVLYFLEEFSIEEIAAATGTSIGTVKSRLHYAKKAFAKLWRQQ